MRFQGGSEKDLASNKLATVTVDRIPITDESKVPNIYVILDDTIYL